MHRVGIDGRALRLGPAGIATYVRNLLSRIPHLERIDHRYPTNNFLWNQIWGPLSQLSRRLDVFHSPSYTSPLINPARLVLSVHDISYLVHPEWYPYRLGRIRLAYYHGSLNRADRILVPSSFTGDELLTRFPRLSGRVRHVPLGVSDDFYCDATAVAEARGSLGVPFRFLLHVGDLHPRRSPELVAEVAKRLGLPLVMVGRLLAGPLPEGPGILHLENIPVSVLRGLYSGADALVYASVYEGFGLPLLEAMACGLPVVVVRQRAAEEVCGEAARFVEHSVESVVSGVREVLADRDFFGLAGREQAAKFSWAETARRTAAVYRELADRGEEEDG